MFNILELFISVMLRINIVSIFSYIRRPTFGAKTFDKVSYGFI